MQLYLDPTGRLLDVVARVVGSPALDEAQPQIAQASEIVDTHSSGLHSPDGGQGGGEASHRGVATGCPRRRARLHRSGHGGGLAHRGCLGQSGEVLHLLVALANVKDLKNGGETRVRTLHTSFPQCLSLFIYSPSQPSVAMSRWGNLCRPTGNHVLKRRTNDYLERSMARELALHYHDHRFQAPAYL